VVATVAIDFVSLLFGIPLRQLATAASLLRLIPG
jgi:hypothetical protein